MIRLLLVLITTEESDLDEVVDGSSGGVRGVLNIVHRSSSTAP